MDLEQTSKPKPSFRAPEKVSVSQKNTFKIGPNSSKNTKFETSSPDFVYKRLNFSIMGFDAPLVSLKSLPYHTCPFPAQDSNQFLELRPAEPCID